MTVWKGHRVVELQSCSRTGGGGGLWVAEVQRCRVAEWLSCRMADCGIAELQSKRDGGLQSWGVAELGSCRVSELQRYRATYLETGIVARLLGWRAAEVQSLEL